MVVEAICGVLGVVLGLLLAKWPWVASVASTSKKPKLVAAAGEVMLRLSGRLHPEVGHQCFDVAGSEGEHHDLLIVDAPRSGAPGGWTVLYLDVTKDGDIRIFSDHQMHLEHSPHRSNVRLGIARRGDGWHEGAGDAS